MIAPEIGLERYPGTDIANLAVLQMGVMCTLEWLGHPAELDVILEALPPGCRQSFDLHASNIDFPGKPPDRPHRAFFEHYFVRLGGLVTYSYGEQRGYKLSDAGL